MVSGHFPNDANGNVLRRMWDGGDSLTQARDIIYTAVFPTYSAAEQFAKHFSQVGYKTSLENSKCVPELPWDVVVTTHAVPTHTEITGFEETLETKAMSLSGRNDGWVCVRLPTAH